jgi:hypothetical protein
MGIRLMISAADLKYPLQVLRVYPYLTKGIVAVKYDIENNF